jgi:hypothetical protein
MPRVVAAIFTALLIYVPPAISQEAKSPALVKQLTQMLDERKLDSIAAPDPQNAGTYVAALYFPGSQLLVVSAKYPAPPLLNDKITKKDYRDVYIDLNSASVAGTKILVMDLNADGLIPKPGDEQGADSYDAGKVQLAFDGAKKSKMSEADYTRAFMDADTAYSHALQLLINQLKSGT